jgi:AraC-like DNA-binding protein
MPIHRGSWTLPSAFLRLVATYVWYYSTQERKYNRTALLGGAIILRDRRRALLTSCVAAPVVRRERPCCASWAFALYRSLSSDGSRTRAMLAPGASQMSHRSGGMSMAASQDPELLRLLLRAKEPHGRRLARGLARARLARVSGVSEAHFARSFKQAFGVPPHRYLLTRRIERATALLRDTDLPITEIAFQTGWESLGTFGRTFRDITGESPSTIRARAGHGARLGRVPACIVSAAHRPDLTTAVSEKRRREAGGTNEPRTTGAHEPRCRSGRSVRARPGRSARVLCREARASACTPTCATATNAG